MCENPPGQQHCHGIPSLGVVDRGRFQIDVDLGCETVTLEDNVTDIFEIWRRFFLRQTSGNIVEYRFCLRCASLAEEPARTFYQVPCRLKLFT